MTNLADLLPAGGGQNNTEFVADGNISAGAPVILTSDGKAKAVSEDAQSASFGSTADYDTDRAYYPALVHDTASGNNVVIYRDSGNNNYPTARVVSVSGSTLTFGTAVVVHTVHADWISADYDASQNKILISYRDDTYSRLRAVVGTVSGTSISFGSAALIGSYGGYRTKVAYNAAANASLIAFSYAEGGGSSNYPYGCVATISGTSVSFGTLVRIESSGAEMSWNTNVYDVASTKNLVAYKSGSGGRAAVATISGTSVSFGTYVDWTTDTTDEIEGVYDSSTSKIALFYRNNSQSYYLYYVVATVSGTSVSFGSQAAAESSGNDYDIAASFDSSVNKHIVTFTLDGGADQYRWLVEGTMSGTTMSFTTKVSADNGNNAQYDEGQCYDPVAKKSLLAITDNTTTTAYMRTYTASGNITNLTATNLLGLAPEAISDTATGTINTWGSRCESSSLLADSLSLGSPDTTSGNSQKENVSMAYDSNADRTILVYRDGADSDKLKCIIGTLSGTSTSWGTAVEIVGATAGNRGTAVVYDSNAQRVLIAYTKADTYVYVRVGEISGTSVTLGTEVAASSSNSYYPELSYDVADQKVLLVFANAGDNYYPYSAACTITAVGNSVAVTTPASVASRNAYDPFGLAYNVNDGKHVLDITDNTSTGYAYVLTMSSGSVSVGAETSYSPGFTPRQSFCVYDSSAQKIVRGYYSNTDPRPVEFAVASISGTSVSFGAAATCFAGNGGRQVSGTFYSSINQLAFFNLPFATSSLETNFGTVSGTTITFGTATTVASSGVSSASYFDMTYDSTAQKLIYAYLGSTFDAVVGSFGTTPLTVASDYYVQEDGTLSTTSTSPAQLIGKAIKTNQINIKDYTG